MASGVCSTLSVRVVEAHALGDTKMFEVQVGCKGKRTSVYKSKEDFKSVLDMFRLVGAMSRGKSDRCPVCVACSAMSLPLRMCRQDALDAFLRDVLAKLRHAAVDAIEHCSSHRGVVQILMDFLNVRHGLYFCALTPEMEAQLALPTARKVVPDDVDVDRHPVSRCSLNRTLSEQFAAMDSVC
ncbi:unnamed protein product [Hyaloperonospora brassicae]|uniref:PX domain-containing protein n=1 Tax=Hyaloperonospora brassicae TaxID=162125 RepID=A0AAV0UKW7_HYABA|nr:unnamed protein product [Hyaloperonospora brassicae]